MWSLFGFLFIAIYLLGRWGWGTSPNEKKVKEMKETLELSIKERTAFNKRIRSDEERQKILNSIAPELEQIFGNDWQLYFNDTGYGAAAHISLDTPWDIVYYVWHAKKGKIQSQYSMAGNEDLQKIKITAGKVIEEIMQTRYPDLELFFSPGFYVARDLKTIVYDDDEICMGYLVWSYVTQTWDHKKRDHLRKLW